ncbi:hypothetical protein GCM10010216_69520 [Streptomyces flaveolus]|nr:hypothetical protein GCM10010216_69520 [Streptomyces flaveolus]
MHRQVVAAGRGGQAQHRRGHGGAGGKQGLTGPALLAARPDVAAGGWDAGSCEAVPQDAVVGLRVLRAQYGGGAGETTPDGCTRPFPAVPTRPAPREAAPGARSRRPLRVAGPPATRFG